MAEEAGNPELAKALSVISTTLMILGGAFTVLGPIVSGVSKVLIANGIAV